MRTQAAIAALGLVAVASAFVWLAQGARASTSRDAHDELAPRAPASVEVAEASASTATPPPTAAPLLREDVDDVRALEQRGFDAGSLAFGAPASDNAALAKTAGWRAIVDVVNGDLRELYAKDAHHGVGMRFTHRGFDPAWLTSPRARMELAAVVNRVDRKVFHPGTCGELRFVYRLAYTVDTKSGPFSSRVPMTLNVVFFLPGPDVDAGCVAAARALEHPERRGALKSVEIDLQSERWPSTVRPDLGGHADYLLRVFRPRADGGLAPAPLENTPDVARLKKDPALRERFFQWLTDPATQDAAEHGTALLPEDLAATRAIGVTPRGLSRLANRPFTQAFQLVRARVQDGMLGPTTLRRLDQLSCMGCHQSRSIAGFHALGRERDVERSNALAVAHSPHLEEDLPRRRAYVDALLAHRTPDDARPAPDHGLVRGAFGDACKNGGDPAWTCAGGLACRGGDPIDDVGECVSGVVGNTCASAAECGDGGVCEAPAVGFPGGMCSGGCDRLDPDAKCGAIALLTPFNDCLARGTLFSECAKLSRPAALRACDDAHPCRADYVCASGNVCLPPYFVLQMRVDGHPLTSTTSRRP